MMMIAIHQSNLFGHIPHGFLGRTGGTSVGIYSSLNIGLGSADDTSAVRENRLLAAHAVLPGASLVTVHQVHSAKCVFADAPWPDDARPHADAIVTNRPGLLLGVLTADCGPVLLADMQNGVVAAAHAGWGGALHGVLASTVACMIDHGAKIESIVAAVGPCIASRSYEVGEDLRGKFLSDDTAHDQFFASGRGPNKYQFDLEGFIALRLAQAGVRKVDLLGIDTYSQAERFFSYRRTTHAGEPDYGRQISLIGLPAA
jgi:polyphenol oxidase